MLEKWSLRREDKKIWVVFLGSVLFSFLLSIVVILIDTRTIPLLDNVPDWMLTSIELAREVLSLLAGSLFAVTTFTFSAMLTIISLYSSNFSPRAVENFLLNNVSMRTLGIFMGGFIYCLSSLVFMRSLEADTLVVSATVALVYAFACVVYFTKFVYHASNYVQLEKLVSRLFMEANEVFDKNIDYFNKKPTFVHLPEIKTVYQYTIRADSNAYIAYVNFNELKSICEKYKAICVIQVHIGVFVSKQQPIAVFYTNQKVKKEKELTNQVNETFAYETERSALFDSYYSRDKLTEVALRAISPAINDPNTAIHVLHYQALLEKKFAVLPGRYTLVGELKEEKDKNDDTLKYMGCVFYEYNDFARNLHRGYWQLIHYMQEDISCVEAIFNSLRVIAYAASKEKLSYVKEYSQFVYDSTYPNFTQRINQQIIEEMHQSILSITPPETD